MTFSLISSFIVTVIILIVTIIVISDYRTVRAKLYINSMNNLERYRKDSEVTINKLIDDKFKLLIEDRVIYKKEYIEKNWSQKDTTELTKLLTKKVLRTIPKMYITSMKISLDIKPKQWISIVCEKYVTELLKQRGVN